MTDDLGQELERLGAALDLDADVLTPEAVMGHPVDAGRPPMRGLTVAVAAAVVVILAATASLLISRVERSTPAGPAIATDESTPGLTSEPPEEEAPVESPSQSDDFVCAPPVGEPNDVVPFDRIVVESFLRAAATDLDSEVDRCGADPAVFLAEAQDILVPALGDELLRECRSLSCENLQITVPQLGSIRAYGNGLVTAELQLELGEGSKEIPGQNGTPETSVFVDVGAIFLVQNGEIIDAVLVSAEGVEKEVIAQAVRTYLDDLASDDPDSAGRWDDFEDGWTPREHLALIGGPDGGTGPGWAEWCALGGRCRDQAAVEQVDLYAVAEYLGSPGGGYARVAFGTGDEAVAVDFWTYVRQGELGVGGLPPLAPGWPAPCSSRWAKRSGMSPPCSPCRVGTGPRTGSWVALPRRLQS